MNEVEHFRADAVLRLVRANRHQSYRCRENGSASMKCMQHVRSARSLGQSEGLPAMSEENRA